MIDKKMMNFAIEEFDSAWQEFFEDKSEPKDDEEDFEGEDELDYAQEEAVVIATKIFEDSWKRIKQEVEGVSKREACKYSFILGFLDYLKMMDKKAEQLEKKIKGMSKEDIEKMVEDFKDYEEKRKS